ncbi:hypothetical protein E2C01_080037 [Portunus trituberculatus]|uniref:Uncharacterized protein n=1 Tax=Portunus trituberculatus TaxID=210409 RepID=A0A5B7IN35_PORTR|nr:hypothetical protein [Portunus trituberculatus]
MAGGRRDGSAVQGSRPHSGSSSGLASPAAAREHDDTCCIIASFSSLTPKARGRFISIAVKLISITKIHGKSPSATPSPSSPSQLHILAPAPCLLAK